MSAQTSESGRSRSEHVGTIDNSRAVLTWTGLGMVAVLVGGLLGGHLSLQWFFGAWAIAVLLAVSKHYHRPATQADVLTEEQWLRAVVDTWSIGRSI